MDKIKLIALSAFTIASLTVALPALAEDGGGGCLSECEPEPEKKKGNNGLGNGDQTAPGGSLEHNKAENQVGNPGHNSGKPQVSN